MDMNRIVPLLAAALLLAAAVACEDPAGPAADPATTSAEVEVERAPRPAATPTSESNSATTEPATDVVGGAAPSPTVVPTATDAATGDLAGAEEDKHPPSPPPSVEETPESPADGTDRQDDTVENLEPSDTPTPEASEAPEASTPETDGEDDPEEPEPTSVPTPELTDAELAALECGNEVGNGDQVITGPSAPEAHDRDSVFRSLTVHPTDPDTVIMGTERNGFVKSTDGGVTWTRPRLGLRWSEGIGYPEVYDLAYSPSDPDVLIAATVSSPGPLVGDFPTTMAGVYLSEDGGETWVRRNCGLTNSRVLSVRFDPSDSNVAVIAIGAGAPSFTTGNPDALDFYEGGMFVTVNRGESWERVPVGDSELISNFSSIVMNPGEPSSLTAFGLHTSQGGEVDTSLNPGFWRSIDGGRNWEPFGPADINGSEVSHFTVSSDGRVIYASVAGTYRHWISLDGGASWVATSINQGGGPVAVSPADSNIVIFRNSHQTSLFRSTDGLRTYNEVVTTEGASTASGERFAFEDIVFAPSDPNRVYAATTGLRVYRSDDGGATFTLMKNIRSEVLNVIP